MERIEIRNALHGWIISYYKDAKQIEEVYIYANELAERIDELAGEMNAPC